MCRSALERREPGCSEGLRVARSAETRRKVQRATAGVDFTLVAGPRKQGGRFNALATAGWEQMVQTRFPPIATEPSTAERLMRFRRFAMFGCMGWLSLMAATGISPVDLAQAARQAFAIAQDQPSTTIGPEGSGVSFRPFGQGEGSPVGLCQETAGQAASRDLPQNLGDFVPLASMECGTPPTGTRCYCRPAEESVRCAVGRLRRPVNVVATCCYDTYGYMGVTNPDHSAILAPSEVPKNPRGRHPPGTTHYRLEPWGSKGEAYRCWCRIPIDESAHTARHFEAIDRDSVAAVGRVLAQIEAWRSGG